MLKKFRWKNIYVTENILRRIISGHLVILECVGGEEVCDVGELVRVLGEAVHLQEVGRVLELAEHGVLLPQRPHARVGVVTRVLALAAKIIAGKSII